MQGVRTVNQVHKADYLTFAGSVSFGDWQTQQKESDPSLTKVQERHDHERALLNWEEWLDSGERERRGTEAEETEEDDDCGKERPRTVLKDGVRLEEYGIGTFEPEHVAGGVFSDKSQSRHLFQTIQHYAALRSNCCVNSDQGTGYTKGWVDTQLHCCEFERRSSNFLKLLIGANRH